MDEVGVMTFKEEDFYKEFPTTKDQYIRFK